jgi:hypothetical protein
LNNHTEKTMSDHDTAMADYTLTIRADSGYESTTEGRCNACQYGEAISALHGRPNTATDLRKAAIDLLDALVLARDHIDMTALEVSHCKDAEHIRAAIARAHGELFNTNLSEPRKI